MSGPELLEKQVGILRTSAGAFFPGERAVFRGCNLHTTLKDLEWFELYVFGITGRRFTPQQVKVLHALWTYTSYPDARLWNNRVAALAGSARSTGTLGISAALAVSEAKIYGWAAARRASEFLFRAKAKVDEGAKLEEVVRAELKQRRGIGGYGRPIVSGDERIAPLMVLVREQGLEKGLFLNLAFEIEQILITQGWRMRMNHAAISAALAADFGMSSQEYYFFGFPAFLAGVPPCFQEAAEKPEGLLFPLPCRMLLYEGVARRSWHGANIAN